MLTWSFWRWTHILAKKLSTKAIRFQGLELKMQVIGNDRPKGQKDKPSLAIDIDDIFQFSQHSQLTFIFIDQGR